MKKIIFIVTAGRSGSSTLTKMFKENGYLTPDDCIKGNSKNQDGFFESKKFVEINKNIISNLSLDDKFYYYKKIISINNQKITTDTQKFYQKVKNIKKLVLKDPRLITTIDYWYKLFKNKNYNIEIIINFREKNGLIKSYIKNMNLSPDESKLLLLFRYISLIEIKKKYNAKIFEFENIFSSINIIKLFQSIREIYNKNTKIIRNSKTQIYYSKNDNDINYLLYLILKNNKNISLNYLDLKNILISSFNKSILNKNLNNEKSEGILKSIAFLQKQIFNLNIQKLNLIEKNRYLDGIFKRKIKFIHNIIIIRRIILKYLRIKFF
jgi:hypothetical protein